MIAKLLCLVGAHRFAELRNDDGEVYTECVRCGKYSPTLTGSSGRGNWPEVPPAA